MTRLKFPLEASSLCILTCWGCGLNFSLISSGYFCPVHINTFNRFSTWTASVARNRLEGYATCVINHISSNIRNNLSCLTVIKSWSNCLINWHTIITWRKDQITRLFSTLNTFRVCSLCCWNKTSYCRLIGCKVLCSIGIMQL